MRRLFKSERGLKGLIVMLIITLIALGGVSINVFGESGSGGGIENDGTKTTSKTPSSDETVYLMTDAKGNIDQTIVSEEGTLHYEGYEDCTVPVSFQISYELDGEKVEPKDLVGKSGHVKMSIKYTNNEKSGSVYVPFMAITGLIMSNDNFSNISVTNGKAVDDGNRNIIVGYSFPGMNENLGKDLGDFTIPETVTISADAKDFSLETIYSFVSNSAFQEMELGDTSDLDDLSSQLDKLTAGVDELVDGTTKVYSGATALAEGVNVLDDTLSEGITKKEAQAAEKSALEAVNAQLADDSNEMSYNNIKKTASETFYSTLTSKANLEKASKEATAGVKDQLGENSAMLSSIKSQAKTKAQETVAKTFVQGGDKLNQLIASTKAQVHAQSPSQDVTDVVTTLAGTYMAQGMSQSEAVAKASEQVSAIVDETVEGVVAGVAPGVASQVAGTVAESTAGTVAQSVGVQVASTVSESVVKSVAEEAKDTVGTSLADSVKQASQVAAVESATTAIDSTKLTIAATIEESGLVSGAEQLAAGTDQLKDGVDSMAGELTEKLSKLDASKVSDLIGKAKSSFNAAKSYKSFGGKGSYDSVKFIYKTEALSSK